MDAVIIQSIITGVITGAVGGAVAGVAAVSAIRVRLEWLRRDVDLAHRKIELLQQR